MSYIAIFGATSDIGSSIMDQLPPGHHYYLAARRPEALETTEKRLYERGAASVRIFSFDAVDTDSFSTLIEDMESTGPIDYAYAMFGVLGDQDKAEEDGKEVARILHTDFTAQAVLLTELAHRMKKRGSGTMIAFSSIAGARVRRPNYIYGSAKAGLDGFVQGMQDALYGSGVKLLMVRPGFVIGSMTEGMKPAPFSSTPDVVAVATLKAVSCLDAGKESHAVWVPRILAIIAQIMNWVPRFLWRRAPR